MIYTINCTDIANSEEFHRTLAESLSFPQWYGHNLDALYDLLSTISKETHLILENWYGLPASFQKFRIVLEEAEANNEMFYVEFR